MLVCVFSREQGTLRPSSDSAARHIQWQYGLSFQMECANALGPRSDNQLVYKNICCWRIVDAPISKRSERIR